MTQEQALTILKTGGNVFLTGEPGSGKTHTVNAYVHYLREYGIEPAITASTGIAATHISGMTIHSWSGIGIRKELSEQDLDKIASNEYVAKRIGKTSVLIIDEISMLDATTLSLVEMVCRAVRQSEMPFGGLQVVLVGDFFQLPPVIRNDFGSGRSESSRYDSQLFEEERAQGIFAFQSPAWKRLSPLVCYLSEQHRQEDAPFLEVLSAIRAGNVLAEHRALISKRKVAPHEIPAGVTKLFSHNADVDRVNYDALCKLPGQAKAFVMQGSGVEFMVQNLKKGCLSPEKLELKAGAAVMFTKNNPQQGYANGTLGEVVGFQPGTGAPLVKTFAGGLSKRGSEGRNGGEHGGKTIAVEELEWTVEENGKVRARITQLPLRLAWAITIHKSQGMSLDAATIDLNAAFEFGQGYVALSRVRTLSGLHLLGFNERSLLVNPTIAEHDESFRIASEEAADAFEDLTEQELEKMKDNFITACGGKKRAPKLATKTTTAKAKKTKGSTDETDAADGPSRLEILRQEFPNAYRPWKDGDDALLKKLFEQGKTPEELSDAFGRQKGSIHARLVKLGLVEEDAT